jgi:hypothetical protein
MSEPVELREVIFDRLVSRLVCRQGARVVAALLRALAQKHMIRTSVDAELERFVERLTPEMLEVTGGNCLPPVVVHLVPRS